MNEEEARKVAAAVSIADGGCSTCIGDICEQLISQLPQWDWAQLIWEEATKDGGEPYWTADDIRPVQK